MKNRKSLFAQYAIVDFASNVLDHSHSRVHSITLPVAACVGRIMARQSQHFCPVETPKTNQILVPVHRVPRTRCLALPSQIPRTVERRRAKRGHLMIQAREDVHMIPHWARPPKTLLRGAKQNQKSVAHQIGGLCRPRSQAHRRCQIHVRVTVPSRLRSQRVRQTRHRSLRLYARLNSLMSQLRTVCANAELWKS